MVNLYKNCSHCTNKTKQLVVKVNNIHHFATGLYSTGKPWILPFMCHLTQSICSNILADKAHWSSAGQFVPPHDKKLLCIMIVPDTSVLLVRRSGAKSDQGISNYLKTDRQTEEWPHHHPFFLPTPPPSNRTLC